MIRRPDKVRRNEDSFDASAASTSVDQKFGQIVILFNGL